MLSKENAEQTVILANLKNNLIVVVVINKMAGFFGENVTFSNALQIKDFIIVVSARSSRVQN